jgi:hypothetical protein
MLKDRRSRYELANNLQGSGYLSAATKQERIKNQNAYQTDKAAHDTAAPVESSRRAGKAKAVEPLKEPTPVVHDINSCTGFSTNNGPTCEFTLPFKLW